jgi:hypothetical protein
VCVVYVRGVCVWCCVCVYCFCSWVLCVCVFGVCVLFVCKWVVSVWCGVFVWRVLC